MSTRTLNLTDNLYHYLLKVSLREPEIFIELRQETAKLPMARMQISPEQAQFMGFLVELIGAKKTLELGVFMGYSTMAVAYALPKDGRVVACDVSKKWTDMAQKFWQMMGVEQKIDLRLAPALKTLDQLLAQGEANTFDFAFIDADKKNYPHYYEKTLQLLRPGGLMAIDNVLQTGKVADPHCDDEIVQVIRTLNEKIHRDERVSMSLVPISDGLTLVRKR